jgi:nickel/cobalt transporter (NicO) family protein
MDFIALGIIGFGLGLLHALDPDHIVAVSTFVGRKPARTQCLRFGLEWGIGHSVSLLLLSGALLLLGKGMNVFLEHALELAVGMVLIGLGIWSFVDLFHKKVGVHSHPHGEDGHEHFHRHSPGATEEEHAHSHAAGWVGLLHGAAGTARFMVLIPVALLGSVTACIAYVLFFSVGVTVSMIFYATFLGRVLEMGAKQCSYLNRVYKPLAGTASLAIGVYWIVAGM